MGYVGAAVAACLANIYFILLTGLYVWAAGLSSRVWGTLSKQMFTVGGCSCRWAGSGARPPVLQQKLPKDVAGVDGNGQNDRTSDRCKTELPSTLITTTALIITAGMEGVRPHRVPRLLHALCRVPGLLPHDAERRWEPPVAATVHAAAQEGAVQTAVVACIGSGAPTLLLLLAILMHCAFTTGCGLTDALFLPP